MAVAATQSPPHRGGWARATRLVEPFFYVAPAVLALCLVMLFPLIVGFSYAFRDIQLLKPFSGGFVGLQHFRTLASDRIFFQALGNTLWWTFGSVTFQFAARPDPRPAAQPQLSRQGRGAGAGLPALGGADLPDRPQLRLAAQPGPGGGPIPHWLAALGIMSEPANILAYPGTAMWGPILANVWYGIPFFAITLLAALQSIPEDIYEAAEIDGASRLQAFWTLTLPLLAPVIAITVLLRTIWIANFADLIVVMTNGGPADTTQTVATYIFTQAFRRLDFGYASAIAVVLLLLLLAYSLCILYLRQRLLASRS